MNSRILEMVQKHNHSHRPLLVSGMAGCYYCCSVFPAPSIETYSTERNGGETAWCPYCHIDAVLPYSVVEHIGAELGLGHTHCTSFVFKHTLTLLHAHFFGRTIDVP